MTSLYELYKARRAEHPAITASHAFRVARAALDPDSFGIEWGEDRHYNKRASFQHEGFDVYVAAVAEADGWWLDGVETYGKFTPKWEDGAVRRDPRKVGRNECPYFLPAGTSLKELAADYRAYHRWSRQVAFERAAEHIAHLLKRAETYGTDWGYVSLKVEVSRAGVVLAGERVGMLADDEPEEAYTEVLEQRLGDLIEEARTALKNLCGEDCREVKAA